MIKVWNSTNIRFADDTVLLACSKMEWLLLLDALVTRSEITGLTLNISKTKVMVLSKEHNPVAIMVKGVLVEQVTAFKYLGLLMGENCNSAREMP